MKAIKCFFCKEKKKCKKNTVRKKNFGSSVNINFSSLTPLSNINDIKCETYFKALDYALKEESIHNIAITGAYGSGKSSVIDSYFRDKCRNELLKISLATFYIEKKGKITENDSIKEKSTASLSETIIHKIEKSILQQIFYRKKGNTFPFSRFKRIKPYNWILIALLELCLIAAILLLTTITKPDWINDLSVSIIKMKWYYLPTLILGCLGFFIAGFFATRFLLKIRLSKFSFQKIEFGLDDINNESLLNRYIDEILYFFEKTKFKIVVFEDLDRFENPEIFFNLRELNSLINNYEKIKNKVIFIYALRDDLFDDVERTKFFDFIIPIVPVIDTHNSKDIMIKKQKQIRSFSKIDEKFLSDISIFIDDMRLLINCINEFQIYDEVVESNNKTKLFALILYKNFYPEDFARLIHNKGELYETINREDFSKKNENNRFETLKEFLVNEKYITKDYIYNISRYYFRDNGNKQSDEAFVKLVKKNENPDFTLVLEDPENVVSKIKSNKWWSNKAILNNSLLDFLLKDRKDYFEENLERFIATMYSYDKYHLKNRFFTQYKHENPIECQYLYKHINNYIQSDNNLTYDVFFDGNYCKLGEFISCVDKDSFDDKFKGFIKKELEFIKPATWEIVYDYFAKINKKESSSELISFINNNSNELAENLESRKNDISFDEAKIEEMKNAGVFFVLNDEESSQKLANAINLVLRLKKKIKK